MDNREGHLTFYRLSPHARNGPFCLSASLPFSPQVHRGTSSATRPLGFACSLTFGMGAARSRPGWRRLSALGSASLASLLSPTHIAVMQERAGCCALRCPNRSAPDDGHKRKTCVPQGQILGSPVEGRHGSGDPRLRNLRLHRLPIANLYDISSTALRSHKCYRRFERQLDTQAASSATRHAVLSLSLGFLMHWLFISCTANRICSRFQTTIIALVSLWNWEFLLALQLDIMFYMQLI